MGIREFLQRRAERGRRIKDRTNELRMEQQIQDRMKSPEEREIIKHLEGERQNELKEEVKAIRAIDTRNFFSAGIMDTTNIFKYHPRIMDMQTRMFERGMFFQ